MIKDNSRSHPFINLRKHVECLLDYNDNFSVYRKYNLTEVKNKEQLEEVIYWHDYGKQNKYFQQRILNVEKKIKSNRNKKKDKHAVISALKYLESAFDNRVEDLENLNLILGHHGNLVSYETLLDKMYNHIDDDDILESFSSIESVNIDNLKSKFMDMEDTYFENESSLSNMESSIKLREKFSRLVDADRLSAMRNSEFHEEDLIERSFNKEAQYYKLMKNTKEDKTSLLSNLRSDIKIDFSEFLQRDSGVFSLILPTGLGKTLTSIELAEKNKNKIIYVVPYLSIADQTWETLNEIYKNRDYKGIWDFMVKHDSRLNENDYYSEDSNVSIKDMITSWRSKIVVTTTIQFFESLISVNASKLRKLHNTYGATILIDEPQTIPYDKWVFLKEIVEEMSKVLKWKVVYMSATPPVMTENTIPLVKNDKYLFSKLNRTCLKYEGKTYGFKAINDWFDKAWDLTKDKSQILWLLNIEKGARKVYKYAKENIFDREVVFISGKLPSIIRMYKLREIKNRMARGEKILVISTQVLEAGIDLDFNGVVRDMAPLPVLLQVAGRLNRRWERTTETVHILQLIENTVYSDYEFRHTGHVLYNRNYVLEEKDYYEACKEYYDLCEEMPPSDTKEVWREEFIKLIPNSMEMIESTDYQRIVPCVNVSDWLDNLNRKGYEEWIRSGNSDNKYFNQITEFKDYFKEMTNFDYVDVKDVFNKLIELETKGIYSKEDYIDFKNYINYISWFNTSCSKSEILEYNETFLGSIVSDEIKKDIMLINIDLL